MPRFYCPRPLAAGALVDLPETVARHLQVLRLAPGAPLTLFNGAGGQYAARLAELDKKAARAELLAFEPVDLELPYRITLAQGLPEGSKMDWIVEKAVELGVGAIAPLAAQRSVVKLAGERADKRREHWEAVVAAASEQCGRNRLAKVEPVAELGRHLAGPAAGQRLLLSPRATTSLTDWARSGGPRAVTLLIGPEGGWSPAEEDIALAAGAIAVSLGARVLRTETAGLAAVTALNAVWGQL